MLQEERRKYQTASIAPGYDTLFADYMLYWLKVIEPNVEVDTFAGYSTNVEKCIVPYFREKKIQLGDLKPIDI